jgi:hypothetical protein
MDTTEDGRKQKENFKALWNGLKANKDWINFVSREKEYMNKIRKK